jgi:hypothetical protein
MPVVGAQSIQANARARWMRVRIAVHVFCQRLDVRVDASWDFSVALSAHIGSNISRGL